MNNDYEIYHAPEDEIPAEDKLRLEAYMRGREDETREQALAEAREAFERLANESRKAQHGDD